MLLESHHFHAEGWMILGKGVVVQIDEYFLMCQKNWYSSYWWTYKVIRHCEADAGEGSCGHMPCICPERYQIQLGEGLDRVQLGFQG